MRLRADREARDGSGENAAGVYGVAPGEERILTGLWFPAFGTCTKGRDCADTLGVRIEHAGGGAVAVTWAVEGVITASTAERDIPKGAAITVTIREVAAE